MVEAKARAAVARVTVTEAARKGGAETVGGRVGAVRAVA